MPPPGTVLSKEPQGQGTQMTICFFYWVLTTLALKYVEGILIYQRLGWNQCGFFFFKWEKTDKENTRSKHKKTQKQTLTLPSKPPKAQVRGKGGAQAKETYTAWWIKLLRKGAGLIPMAFSSSPENWVLPLSVRQEEQYHLGVALRTMARAWQPGYHCAW